MFKIFEWDDFCSDWTSGMAIVIAENLKHAREILWNRCQSEGLDYDYVRKEIYGKDPHVYNLQEKVFYVCGS